MNLIDSIYSFAIPYMLYKNQKKLKSHMFLLMLRTYIWGLRKISTEMEGWFILDGNWITGDLLDILKISLELKKFYYLLDI